MLSVGAGILAAVVIVVVPKPFTCTKVETLVPTLVEALLFVPPVAVASAPAPVSVVAATFVLRVVRDVKCYLILFHTE